MIKILVVEDDKLFAQTLEDFLSGEGFSVDICFEKDRALDLCYEKNFDLLLLDINLGKSTGIDLLKALRNGDNKTPAIYLTSYKDKETLLKGFKSGADDYLRKPVDLDELLLRINAILKRSNKILKHIFLGEFTYDPKERTLFNKKEKITLSKKLALLLELFIENRSVIVTKDMIKSKLWEWNENPSDGAIRVYINDLKKIFKKEKIKNIKGLGYRFEI